MNSRSVDADFFKDPAAHHRHHAAAKVAAAALPRHLHEAPRRIVAHCALMLVFELFESRANPAAQLLKPAFCAVLLVVNIVRQPGYEIGALHESAPVFIVTIRKSALFPSR